MNNPYGHYRRHNTTTAEHMAALWKEVAREHAARSSSARQYARDCHDSMDAAIRRANRAEFDAATYLADRDAAEEERDEAVQERDELRQARRRLLGKVDQLEVKLRDSGRSAEQAQALTPDYRSPAQKFAEDLMHLICTEYKTHGHARESWDIKKPHARVIETVVGGVKFTVTVQEGNHRA